MMKPMWRNKVTRWPSHIIHAARRGATVPACMPASPKAWHKMPDNQDVTCKNCQRIMQRETYRPREKTS